MILCTHFFFIFIAMQIRVKVLEKVARKPFEGNRIGGQKVPKISIRCAEFGYFGEFEPQLFDTFIKKFSGKLQFAADIRG